MGFVSIERGNACLSVCVSLCCMKGRPGNRAGVKEKSWGAGSELLADVLCWAGCAVCFCSEGDRETKSGEGEEQRERSRVDMSHCLSMKACSNFWKSIQKTSRLYLLFSFPFLLFGEKPLLSIAAIRLVGGCAVRKPDVLLLFKDVLD